MCSNFLLFLEIFINTNSPQLARHGVKYLFLVNGYHQPPAVASFKIDCRFVLRLSVLHKEMSFGGSIMSS